MKKKTPKHKTQERKKNSNLICEEVKSNISSKRSLEEIKRLTFEEKEVSSKKLKISNNNTIIKSEKTKKTETLNSSIFQFIPGSIWEIVFNLLNDKREIYKLLQTIRGDFYIKIPMNNENFYSLRLCCKLFRNIISKYWIQYIPGNHLENYIKNCNKFQFSPQNIFIIKPRNKKFKCLKFLPKNVQSIKFDYELNIENSDLQFLPSTIQNLDLENCENIDVNGLKYLPSFLKSLNIKFCHKITLEDLKYLPSTLQSLNIPYSVKIDYKNLMNSSYNIKLLLSSYLGIRYLIESIKSQDLELIKELLHNGLNINQIEYIEGYIAPLIAACKKNLESVKELINNGANVNSICSKYLYFLFSSKDLIKKDLKYSFTPIYIAWWNDKEEVISILKDISDIELNIQLAKQNNHPNTLKFFESLL